MEEGGEVAGYAVVQGGVCGRAAVRTEAVSCMGTARRHLPDGTVSEVRGRRLTGCDRLVGEGYRWLLGNELATRGRTVEEEAPGDGVAGRFKEPRERRMPGERLKSIQVKRSALASV